jgi:hypothetical protein
MLVAAVKLHSEAAYSVVELFNAIKIGREKFNELYCYDL